MSMTHRAQPSSCDASIGAGHIGVRGYWFIPGVPVAMS